MKSKLIRTAEKNGFTKAGSDGAQVRYLKPINNDFSYGFLIGRTGKDDITAGIGAEEALPCKSKTGASIFSSNPAVQNP